MDEDVRLSNRSRSSQPPPPPPTTAESVYVPSKQAEERRSRRWLGIVAVLLSIVLIAAVAYMVFRPRLRPLDSVEKVADRYLNALAHGDQETAGRLGVIEDPPGIGSYRDVTHQKASDRTVRGSFATLGALHNRIDSEFTYDETAGRFTPKNALGIAGETLDALHAAKDEAEKSGLYDKIRSGDPDDLFDAAEQLAKFPTKLAETTLAPKRILPTYRMLVEEAKPPLSNEARALAMTVAENPRRWMGLLKRPFWTLKPDGPFIYEEAVVTATGRDRLASLGDPPTHYRLNLVRFRLEGIDTGWRVVSSRRVQPGEPEPQPDAPTSTTPYELPPPASPNRVRPDF